jgi:hypothetical protein
VETGEKNTSVTRHAQCSGRMFEAGKWNNRESQTVRTGRLSTKMRVSKQEAKLHLIFPQEHRMLIKHYSSLNVIYLNTKFILCSFAIISSSYYKHIKIY